jgi:hypothetical protein
VADQFRDTVAVPGGSDEPVREGMVTVHHNGFVQACIPTRSAKLPSGPDWVTRSRATA